MSQNFCIFADSKACYKRTWQIEQRLNFQLFTTLLRISSICNASLRLFVNQHIVHDKKEKIHGKWKTMELNFKLSVSRFTEFRSGQTL